MSKLCSFRMKAALGHDIDMDSDMDMLVLLCSQITLGQSVCPLVLREALAAQHCFVAPVVLRGVGCGPGSAHWGDGHFLEKIVSFEYTSISISMESHGLVALSVACWVARLLL